MRCFSFSTTQLPCRAVPWRRRITNSAFQFCISAAPAALDRYLAAVPAMSLIPFVPFSVSALRCYLLAPGFL
jgi:hypothetical protein